MLRSEPRLHPDVLDELDRLDAAIHAARWGVADPAPAPGTQIRGRSTSEPDATLDPDAVGTSTDADPDDLDRELLDLVSAVRTGRPSLDPGVRSRLDERVQAAKDADAAGPGRRLVASLRPADRRWRAGLAVAAVVAVALPVGVVARDGITGDGGPGPSASSESRIALAERGTTEGPASAAGSATADSAAGADADARESLRSTEGDVGRLSGTAPEAAATPEALQELDRADDAVTRDSIAPSPPSAPTTKPAPLDATRRVIRDVEQTVRVNPGDVARSAGRVTTIVQDAGGYLASSEVRERGAAAGATFGVVVPTGKLDATVAALSRIGKPVRLERTSTDVTDQATSLDDQLADLRADRSAARLALARTVDPQKRAARRRELNLLSSRVASLQGQRDALRRQTATSRIDLRLTTSKAADDDPAPPVDDGAWGIGDAWDDAGRVLEVGGGVLLIGGVIVLPPLVLVLGGLALRRRAAARRREDAIDAA